MKKNIPNFFTLLNLLFGCLAIVYTLQNGLVIQYGADDAQIINVPEKICWAGIFIFLAAIVDFLDGFVARLFKATSAMGAQLDSLADVVSFGVAPSMLIYQFLRLSFAAGEDGLNISTVWLLPAFLIASCGAWRLARFNINLSATPDVPSTSFSGLPIPAAGILVASFPLIYWFDNTAMVNSILLNKWFLYGVILLLSWLMVSRLPMLALKFKDYSFKHNKATYILLMFSALLIIFLHWLAVPFIFIVYLAISLLFKNMNT